MDLFFLVNPVTYYMCVNGVSFVYMWTLLNKQVTVAHTFKMASCVIFQVATSVAARGLDVKELILVVNYDCPNHYEDYVHRCG